MSSGPTGTPFNLLILSPAIAVISYLWPPGEPNTSHAVPSSSPEAEGSASMRPLVPLQFTTESDPLGAFDNISESCPLGGCVFGCTAFFTGTVLNYPGNSGKANGGFYLFKKIPRAFTYQSEMDIQARVMEVNTLDTSSGRCSKQV